MVSGGPDPSPICFSLLPRHYPGLNIIQCLKVLSTLMGAVPPVHIEVNIWHPTNVSLAPR